MIMIGVSESSFLLEVVITRVHRRFQMLIAT